MESKTFNVNFSTGNESSEYGANRSTALPPLCKGSVPKGTKRSKRKINSGQNPPCKKQRGGKHAANTSSTGCTEPVEATEKEARAVGSDTSSGNISGPAKATKRKATTTEELYSGSCSRTRPVKRRHVKSKTGNRFPDSGKRSAASISGKKDTQSTGKFHL